MPQFSETIKKKEKEKKKNTHALMLYVNTGVQKKKTLVICLHAEEVFLNMIMLLQR